MQRQVPTWVAVVAVVAVVVVVALIYMFAQRRGAPPVQPVGTVPQPGQVKGGSPYEKGPIPPGAPPFMKQRPGGGQ